MGHKICYYAMVRTSTYDTDNDASATHCSATPGNGGWWFTSAK